MPLRKTFRHFGKYTKLEPNTYMARWRGIVRRFVCRSARISKSKSCAQGNQVGGLGLTGELYPGSSLAACKARNTDGNHFETEASN